MCKALLDMVVIDDELQTVQPIDIKTTGEYPENFHRVAKRFRYDIQAAFYTLALSYAYPEYTILPFQFLVESTVASAIGTPLLYTCTESDLLIGRYGGKYITEVSIATQLFTHTKYTDILGFEDGIREYKKQLQSKLDIPYKLVEEPERELSIWT